VAITQKQKNKLLELIKTQLKELNLDIQDTEERIRNMQEHRLLPIASGPGEDGTSAEDQDRARLELISLKKSLGALASTKLKLENGTYTGTCGICRNPIDFNRILALPGTNVCTACAKKAHPPRTR